VVLPGGSSSEPRAARFSPRPAARCGQHDPQPQCHGC